jgi:hypothetical protein
MNPTFSIRQSSEPIACGCALCGNVVRWAAGPRLCVDGDVPAVACRDCGRRRAPELAALLEGIEAYAGERSDLQAKRDQCLDLVLGLTAIQHGDVENLTYLRAVGSLFDALPQVQIALAIEAAWQSNPEARNRVRVMPMPPVRSRRA